MNTELVSLEELLADNFADEEKRQLVANIAADVTRVSAQALTDPAGAAEEMGFINAAVANFSAAEAAKVQAAIVTWLSVFVRKVIIG